MTVTQALFQESEELYIYLASFASSSYQYISLSLRCLFLSDKSKIDSTKLLVLGDESKYE